MGARLSVHAEPSLNEAEIRRRVAGARVATLATVEPDGRPHLVPITFVLDGDVLYTAVDHKPKTTAALRRLANIRRDPRVTVLVQSYDEDWTQLWWCRLRGTARVVGEVPHLLAAKYEQYAERPPAGPGIEIAIAEWTGWSAT